MRSPLGLAILALLATSCATPVGAVVVMAGNVGCVCTPVGHGGGSSAQDAQQQQQQQQHH